MLLPLIRKTNKKIQRNTDTNFGQIDGRQTSLNEE